MLSVEPLREKGYEELRRISVYNDAISQWDEIYVNQNQYAFPLIYAVNKEDGEMIEKMMGGAYDYEALQRMFPRIAGMEITEFRESMLTGVLDAGDECVLLTSIPYDPGWRIYVDDEKTLVRVVNYGFLGADLQPGQHRISMKFIPQGLDAGLAVTFVTLAVLIAGILIKRKGSKKLWMA